MAVFPVVRGLKLRATKTNNCGRPIAGPQNRLVTKGFVTFKLSPVMKDAEELEQTNAAGKVCVSDRTPPERKWYNIEAQLCNVNTGLITLLNGWPQVLDYNDVPIGFRDQTEVDGDFGVVLEVWTGGKSEQDCPVPLNDDVFETDATGLHYGYFLVGGKEFTLGDIEVGASVSTFTMTGISMAIPQWGKGPYNVQDIDSDGTAGRLIEAMDDDSHFTLFRTAIAPPDVTPGSEPVALEIASKFTDPDFYYGGPGNAPAAEVAPDQDDTITTVLTITGSPTGGTFTVTFNGHTTGTVAYNASAATLKTALVALDDGFGASDWSVSGSDGGPYTITRPAGTLSASGAGLTGGTSPAVALS